MDTTNHKKTKLQEKIFINTLKSRMNSIGPGSPLNIGQYNQDVMQNVIDRMQFKKDNFQLNKESVNFSRKWSTKELAKYYTSGFVPEFWSAHDIWQSKNVFQQNRILEYTVRNHGVNKNCCLSNYFIQHIHYYLQEKHFHHFQ